MVARDCFPLSTLLVGAGVLAPFFVLLGHGRDSTTILENYWTQRAALLREEDDTAFGNRLQYKPGERFVNEILMAAKREELAEGFRTPSKFAPSRSFLEASGDIENSKVFGLIKKMPKGGVLHSHASAIVSKQFVFNVTYRDDLYVCETGINSGDRLALRFFDEPNDDCDWRLLNGLRRNPEVAKSLDRRINDQLSMRAPLSSAIADEDGNAAWSEFERIFEFTSPILKYRPVHEEHFYRGLEELLDDGVIYLELRATLHPVYELNGTEYEPIDVARIYKNVAERFARKNPKFVGVKLIYAPSKTADPRKFDEFVRVAKQLKMLLPDFFVGFDLVGQEDASPPLSNWFNRLRTLGRDMTFFFHAGETKSNGIGVDDNLLDAVLLNTKRIGHGYALVKHPKVLELVRDKKIAIEICPISNQVLRLVKDLRNHPASFLFANDFPVVVSNDDPGFWGAKGLSYDFYEAFMGIMSARADLRSIKQLAINSIQYSSLGHFEKVRALSIWSEQWSDFVRSFHPKNEKLLV